MAGMKRAVDPLRLAAGAIAVAGVMALLPFLRGVLIVGKHEGDTLHLADMVLRMAEAGQIPHHDFMTPIGILALWPIAVFVKAGLGLGQAFFAAQALVAAVLIGPAVRAAASRLPGALAWALAIYVVVLCLSLVHGEANAATSVSMHYNRWAWAMAYVALPLALLAPIGARRPWLDGALIGLMLAGMALIKVTYFAAFAPPIAIALIARREGRAALAAALAGLAVMAGVTALLGADFWRAYLHDLATVAASESRSAPGESFAGVLAAPAYIAGTFVALSVVILLRQAGRMTEGMALLFLVPGFFYVTYQNFGNDPQWLVLLALIALALRPEGGATNVLGWRLREALGVAGAMALALGAASVVNMMWSPVRHAFDPAEDTVPLLSMRPQHADVLVTAPRVYRVSYTVAGDGAESPYAGYAEQADRDPPAVLNGETLADCELQTGYNAWFETTAKDLMAAGYGGSGVLLADLFTALWLYGDFKPVEGAAPWYYDGTPGLEAADHVLVPLCPTGLSRRADILGAIDKAGWSLREERRTETYILLKPVKD